MLLLELAVYGTGRDGMTIFTDKTFCARPVFLFFLVPNKDFTHVSRGERCDKVGLAVLSRKNALHKIFRPSRSKGRELPSVACCDPGSSAQRTFFFSILDAGTPKVSC